MKNYFFLITLFFLNIVNAKVGIKQEPGFSFDDVLLVPKKSSVSSRSLVSTKTRLTRNISIEIPIVSANMDTVTEWEMAIAMARKGGIGIIHRFNTIDDQVSQVKRVKAKQYSDAVIENPLTVKPTDTIKHAKEIMRQNNVTGLLVVNDKKQLVGILTSRDIRFRPSDDLLVSQLMTPQHAHEQLIVGKAGISIQEAQTLLMQHRIEKLPLINPDWTIAGLITGKDIHTKSEYPYASVDSHGRLRVGAAIGVGPDSRARAEALIKAGVDVLVIDIAHGHSDLAINMIKEIKTHFPTMDVIAGNVCTPEATCELIEAGADAVKVGIGPGSICTTRIVAGSGYPQLSAIIECAEEAAKYNVPIIADGGIKVSGDIAKAIAGGASTVMLGSLLAGTEESPGMTIIKGGKKVKVIRGMASFGANLSRNQTAKDGKNAQNYVPEGVEALVPFKGDVAGILDQLVGGLASGMSYCGATTIEELCGNGLFVQITSAGVRESNVHDVDQLT